MRRVLFFFSLFVLCSCQKVLLISNGIYKPRVQSIPKLEKFLLKQGLSSESAIYLKDNASRNQLLSIDGTVPEILIFDKNGSFIPYKADTSCNAGAFDYLDKFCVGKIGPALNSSDSLSKYLSFFDVKTAKRSEYTVIIKWCEFSGRLNRDHVKVWMDTLNKQSCSKTVYLANFDMLEEWGRKLQEAK